MYKKDSKRLAIKKECATFAHELNRASDYGSEGYRFESYASHPKENGDRSPFFMQHRSLPNKLMCCFSVMMNPE